LAAAAETLVDKAMEIDHFGGTFGGNRKATPFMCLTLKMLQIQPEKEIVVEFIKNDDYKCVCDYINNCFDHRDKELKYSW
jgi:pre-mRNA-splicing factor 38A